MRRIYSLALFLLLISTLSLHAQFTVNSAATQLSATAESNCFQLTPADFHMRGSVFNNTQIDLNQDFVANTKLYFGATDDGGDGLAFVFQNEGPNYIGNFGAGIGYHRFATDVPGPVPSFIIEFDTWQNGDILGQDIGDPAADHVGFMSNSNAYHTSPTALKAPEGFSVNIEDDQWHDAKFTWNALTKTMTVVVTITTAPLVQQTFTYTGDIVNTLFGGNSMVYWGFTAGTGSIVPNVQSVCIITPPSCTPGKTYTPGGWGAPPNGGNAGAYLHAHFTSAFPSGVTVGTTGNNHYAKWTTAQAITNYMPGSGQAKALTTSYINPTSSSLKNTLVGHLLALTLAVRFDQVDPNFSSSNSQLGDYVIASGPFTGWTVSNFLTEANKILGGGASAYTIDNALTTASAINMNYDNGTVDLGYLTCPTTSGTISRNLTLTESNAKPAAIAVLPNPTRGQFELRLTNMQKGNAQVLVTSVNGGLVEKRFVQLTGSQQTLSFNLANRPSGIYMISLVSPSGVQTYKMVIDK